VLELFAGFEIDAVLGICFVSDIVFHNSLLREVLFHRHRYISIVKEAAFPSRDELATHPEYVLRCAREGERE
jgi:hypothetical protein